MEKWEKMSLYLLSVCLSDRHSNNSPQNRHWAPLSFLKHAQPGSWAAFNEPERMQPCIRLPQMEQLTQLKWNLTGPWRAQQSAGSPKTHASHCHTLTYCHTGQTADLVCETYCCDVAFCRSKHTQLTEHRPRPFTKHVKPQVWLHYITGAVTSFTVVCSPVKETYL